MLGLIRSAVDRLEAPPLESLQSALMDGWPVSQFIHQDGPRPAGWGAGFFESRRASVLARAGIVAIYDSVSVEFGADVVYVHLSGIYILDSG